MPSGMVKNKYIIIAVAVVLLLIASAFAGLIPLQVTGVDTVTVNNNKYGIKGYGEVFQPFDAKGFITSWLNDGHSESISVRGKLTFDWNFGSDIDKYYYVVYGGKTIQGGIVDYSDVLSSPDISTMYLSAPNPGKMDLDLRNIRLTGKPDPLYLNVYDFTFMGFDYDALKVELYVHHDNSLLNIFDEGYKWKVIQTDEVRLYSGQGGLYYHQENNELLPRQTYEVGEVVIIDVHTGFGGQTSVYDTSSITMQSPSPWTVKLRNPQGDVIQTQEYDDDVIRTFQFEVTEDMYDPDTNNEYQLEIWNTWVSMGALNVYTIDILEYAPSSVTFDVSSTHDEFQTSVGQKCTVSFSSISNPLTGLPIESFRVAVIYGTHQNLMPSNSPTDPIWLIYKRNVQSSGSSASITFEPEKESYITVFANAQDSQGRTNLYPSCWTIWAYQSQPAPQAQIEDYVGFHWYKGGQSSDWLPWDPAGVWDTLEPQSQSLIVAVAIFLLFLFLGSFLPKNQKIIAIIIGAILSVIAYAYMSGLFGEIVIPTLNIIKGVLM